MAQVGDLELPKPTLHSVHRDPLGDLDGTVRLGAILYRHRVERGLSLRTMARRLGLSAHSGLLDYERGRRIPPEDLLSAYERVFELPADRLCGLRRQALAERAAVKTAALIAAQCPVATAPHQVYDTQRNGAGAEPSPSCQGRALQLVGSVCEKCVIVSHQILSGITSLWERVLSTVRGSSAGSTPADRRDAAGSPAPGRR